MQRRGTPSAIRGSLLTRVSVVSLLAFVAVVAAVQGTPGYTTPAFLTGRPPTVPMPSASAPETAPPQEPLPDFEPNETLGKILEAVGIVLASLIVIGVGYLLARWVRRLWRDRELRRMAGSAVVAPLADLPSDEPTPDAPTLRRGVAGALERLDSGTPSDAIVAAGLAVEQTAADSGLDRGAAETAGEFAVRIVTHRSTVRRDAEDLLRLYEGVRFGSHRVSEPERDAARTCLRHIEEAWR